MQRILSEKAYEEALKYIPGGVNSPVRALKSVGTTPLFIRHAKGCTITDIDSNDFTDFCMSWGVFIAGHANPRVLQAVCHAVANGTSYGIPTTLETDLAKLIVSAVPSIEKVRLVNSGTEAVMSAGRLARAYTGRDKIVKFDGCYHGHADHLLVSAGSGVANLSQASSAGVPADFVNNTASVPYNNIEAIEELFRKFPNQISAVIIEPVAANMGVVLPSREFLSSLRELTRHYKSLLIFDEVITGFRVEWGGAQQYFGITPDITTLGKIIGGGFPVGAYGGRSDIMSLVAPDGPVYQAGTLSGNPVAVSAGIATLEIIQAQGFYESLHQKSLDFFGELNLAIRDKGLRLQTIGSMFTLFFSESELNNFSDVKKCDTERFAAFFRKLLENGVYLSPSQFESNFISLAHTTDDLGRTLEVIRKVLKEI
jgi:glutamate-1-semialdehyde 2,1-aminomutase